MLETLLVLGTTAHAIKGAEFLASCVERLTGVPVHTGGRAMVADATDQVKELVIAGGDLLIEGFGESAAGFLDPLHLFTPDPAQERDQALAQKKREAKKRKAAEKLAAAAQAQATDADARAAQLEQQAAEANARATTAEAAAAAAQKAQKAKAGRGFARLTSRLAGRSQAASASGNTDQALAIAQQAMAMAMVAMKPPTDAREALRSGDDDRTRQLKTDTINAINRDGADADLEGIADRLTNADPEVRQQAQQEFQDQADLMGAAGHDCGGSCDGACKACQAKGGSAYDWNAPTPEIAGRDIPGDGFSWDASSSSTSTTRRTRERAPAPIIDESAISRALTYSGTCRTGSCPVTQYR
jgi:hypothetical protein